MNAGRGPGSAPFYFLPLPIMRIPQTRRSPSAHTKTQFHHLCSIKVRSGEQEYVIYEVRAEPKPLSEKDYYREILEFCGYLEHEIPQRLKDIEEEGEFEEWPYDDRLYVDPWVQEITEAEYDVLRRYLRCR